MINVLVVIAKGGQSEIVHHDKNGFLWNSLEELQESTMRLIHDVILMKTLSQQAVKAGRKYLKKFFPSGWTNSCWSVNKMKEKLRSFRLGEALALGTLITLLITGIYYAFNSYVNFDEAFNLQIPANLVQHGEYGTTYDGGQLFDPVITTGPTVLLPIAAIFKLFGVGIISARLITYLYCAIAILLLAWISYKLAGWLATLMVVAFVSFLPNFFEFGFKVMGEIPGIVFFLIGMLAISRNKGFLGGLLLGLSALTKLSFLISLGPLALFYGTEWLWLSKAVRKALIQSFLKAIVGFCLPLLMWEGVRLVSLGPSAYWKNLEEFLSLIGIIPGPRHLFATSSFSSRLSAIGIPYDISSRSVILIGVASLGGLMLWVLIAYRASLLQGTSNNDGKLYWLLSASGITFLGWWLLASPSDWWRHLLPAYIVWGLVVCVALGRWLMRTRLSLVSAWTVIKDIGLCGVLALIIIYPAIIRFGQVQYELKQTYACQMDLAQQIRQMSEQKALFGYWGWFQSPELSFLSQKSFYDIANPQTRTNLSNLKLQGYQPYVIISWVQESAAAATLTDESPFLRDLVLQECGFKIYNFADAQP